MAGQRAATEERDTAGSRAGAEQRADHTDLLSPALAGSFEEMSSSQTRGRRTTLAASVEKLERELIEQALERSAGNISETARVLGLTRRGLYLKMERLGVEGAKRAL